MKKKITQAMVLFVATLLLCGCQQSPDKNSVVSKNDGTFDISVIQSATRPQASAEVDPNTKEPSVAEEIPTKKSTYKDNFFSTDGTVAFTINLETFIPDVPMPVVEVVPHYLTGADAKRVAEVLFEGEKFYEAQPTFSTVYSKPEIQEKLMRWSQYTSDEAIERLFGSPQINATNVVQDFIERYTQLMETAPEMAIATPCLWQFQESWRYNYTAEQVKTENISVSSDDEIRAYTSSEGIPYRFTASTRNKSDFKYNMIFALPDYGISPWGLDEMILQARLCRDKKPTDEQIACAKSKAEEWLNNLNLGEWTIDTCNVLHCTNGDARDYKISVQAVPTFNGAAAIRRPQLNNLKSKEQYASNYYLTDSELIFSPDGTLLSFQLFSPVDVKRVVNNDPAVLDMDKLMENAKNFFQLTDAYFYGIGGSMDESGVDINCQVDIDNLEYGLPRVKVPDTDDSYYYVPSIALSGDIQYTISDTGEVCFRNENTALLLLNAVDGSIIPFENE